MNIQAMMKQAQQIQKDMMKSKNEIDSKLYEGKSSLVTIEMYGSKKVNKVSIDKEKITDLEDLDLIEDMIVVALNDAMNQIDKETEQKLGKYTKGMPGLF